MSQEQLALHDEGQVHVVVQSHEHTLAQLAGHVAFADLPIPELTSIPPTRLAVTAAIAMNLDILKSFSDSQRVRIIVKKLFV